MKTKTFLFLLLISKISMAQSQLNFKQTWVFMVGVLEWADKNSFASFEKKDRLDAKIFNFFKNNGVPESQMMYLQDKQATTTNVREQMNAFLKNAQKGDVLFFYYCGHGYRNDGDKVCFANYKGTDWTVEEIVKTVNQNFAGNTAFFAADCCNSGGLAEEVQKYQNKNFVALNSVVPTDISTGNWTFSNALLYALKGENFVDLNNDQQITLGEFTSYFDQEMAIVEEQKAAYFVPKSMQNWVLASNISPKKHKRIGERVNVKYDGEDYLGFITDAKNNQFNVRFYSYTNNETDWVEASRIKPFVCKKDFPVGTSIKVFSTDDEKWYPAKVLKKFSCLHYIHYVDYGSEYDVWVSSDNIKK